MSAGTATPPPYNQRQQRRFQRYTLAVPVEVVVLKFGIPAAIPGRAVNVSEGGIAAVIAGELRPGDTVGVNFRLAAATEIRAKAVVRHSWLMRSGLEFLGMDSDQEIALRTWATMTGALIGNKEEFRSSSPVPKPLWPTLQEHSAAEAPHGRRFPALWLVGTVLLLLLAGAAWLGWNNAWSDGSGVSEASEKTASGSVVDVPSSVMQQRLIHRTVPIYPAAALQARTQGSVVLDAIIGADGSVENVQPVSGADALVAAAVDAVKWWRFEPYRLNGTAVQVHTMIEVDFRLSP